MKLQHEHLLKGLEFALNYHGIDAKANMADFKLAELLAPQVIHGAECAKTGADPAMTPNYKTVVTGKPTDIEALAQRLAKVEDGWAAANRDVGKLHARIDKAAEIIGAHIGGLVDRIENLEIDKSEPHPFGVQPNPPGFPTGAGTTVEDAIAQVEEPGAESEPLKPQRGDRVRLEGARSPSGRPISDGWYDVIGGDATEFQVHDKTSGELSHFSPWLSNSSPSLKEVRRGAAKLPE